MHNLVVTVTNETYQAAFLDAAGEWICDSYSTTIHYLALIEEEGTRLLEAAILVSPVPRKDGLSFRIDVAGLSVGAIQLDGQSRDRLMDILDRAAQGAIEVDGLCHRLSSDQPLDFHTEMAFRDRWFSDLHLTVIGPRPSSPAKVDFAKIDNQLRLSDPPFDGLADVVNWLGLTEPQSSHIAPSINIRILPPVDLIINSCRLHDDELTLTLHAHPKFDVTRVGLATRAVPGNGLAARQQVSTRIVWSEATADYRQGIVQIQVECADSVLAILMSGETSVRRQWFLDPAKARNSRFVAMQLFDKELRMVRQAVLDPQDSGRFEKGVAALLFLLGFSAAIQVETDSPDIIVATAGGRVVLVECTTRIADFAAKVGKLVDRCRTLSKTFESSSHYAPVYGVLVCGLPRDQIALRESELEAQRLFLITKDELASAFDKLRFPSDPDEMLDAIIAKSSQKDMFQNGRAGA